MHITHPSRARLSLLIITLNIAFTPPCNLPEHTCHSKNLTGPFTQTSVHIKHCDAIQGGTQKPFGASIRIPPPARRGNAPRGEEKTCRLRGAGKKIFFLGGGQFSALPSPRRREKIRASRDDAKAALSPIPQGTACRRGGIIRPFLPYLKPILPSPHRHNIFSVSYLGLPLFFQTITLEAGKRRELGRLSRIFFILRRRLRRFRRTGATLRGTAYATKAGRRRDGVLAA